MAPSTVQIAALEIRNRRRLVSGSGSAHLGNFVLDVGEKSVDVVTGIYADALHISTAQRGDGGFIVGESGRLFYEGLLKDGAGHLGHNSLRRRRVAGGVRGRKSKLRGAARGGGNVPNTNGRRWRDAHGLLELLRGGGGGGRGKGGCRSDVLE